MCCVHNSYKGKDLKVLEYSVVAYLEKKTCLKNIHIPLRSVALAVCIRLRTLFFDANNHKISHQLIFTKSFYSVTKIN